jgi:hypothetical protein
MWDERTTRDPINRCHHSLLLASRPLPMTVEDENLTEPSDRLRTPLATRRSPMPNIRIADIVPAPISRSIILLISLDHPSDHIVR